MLPMAKSDPGEMELFKNALTVKLQSHKDKYLLADEDQESVTQDRNGGTNRARWGVEFVESVDNVIRLRSCYEKYLTASGEQFLLGATGRKVLQTPSGKLDSQVEWEPIRDGYQVRLKTRCGYFLRANGGVPPWRNSITHDIPGRHKDWVLWEVDIVEKIPNLTSEPLMPLAILPRDVSPSTLDLGSSSNTSPNSAKLESKCSNSGSQLMKNKGRMIYYSVLDDSGEEGEETSFQFTGMGLEELTVKLEEETGLENIIVCSRNKIKGQLYPLMLALPPNNTTMHVVVVPSTSKVGRDLLENSAIM